MKRLPFGTVEKNKSQAVFTAIMTESIQPWEFHYVKHVISIKCPAMIVIRRWDGRIGFPGGFVDNGESLRDAAAREIKEEIGIEVEPNRLTEGYTFHNNISIHLMKLIVKEKEFLQFLQAAWINSASVVSDLINRKFYPNNPLVFEDMNNVNFFTEVNGIEPVYITEIKSGKCFPNFLKNPFPPVMIEQLVLLSHEYNWADKKSLIKWFNSAGYNYENILDENQIVI